jgi:predicted alpha/beta-fold hydrolase
MDTMEFRPPRLLRSPHVQTLLSSRLVRGFDTTGFDLLQRAATLTLECRDAVRLQAVVNADRTGAPLVIVVHGWLGRADSPYVRRASTALYRAGFNVARLLLRDHGDTAGLNPELFNAARIDEVVDACNLLAARHGSAGTGLMGFSLGGNFSLRVAAHPDCSPAMRACLAVCPVVDPATSAAALDAGWAPYRWYFVRKWREAFAAKAAAFPGRYDFSATRRMDRIGALTDYLVERYTPFANAADYYAHYTLTPARLAPIVMQTRVLATADDPVIPLATVEPLRGANGGLVELSARGGHCAFIENYGLRSALDAYAVRYFQRLR